tara:strand:- start:707 stop:1744 length:1038 start_codon:yes stop_codon:yes gene_type:complete
MATLGTTALTYGDWAKRIGPQGNVDTIIELLSQDNEIMQDEMVVEGNQPTGHVTTVRTGIPSGTWRLLNYGVPTGKSTTVKITDNCGMLETYSVIDKALADLNGNSAAFRLSEDMAFLQGLNQQMAQTMIYGNTSVNPERFMGLAPRYNTTASAQTGVNVIDAGGTGSVNTSIWLVCWGPNTCHGIFPKGQMAGLRQTDKGDITPAYDANNNRYEAYTTHYKWDLGLCLRDWRFVVRIANIDSSLITGASAPNLINALIRAVHRIPVMPAGVSTEQTSDAPQALSYGQPAIYCNRTVRTWLDIQALNKTNMLLQFENWHGRAVTTFRGIPVRTVDSILNNESRIT